jgi:tetratricopeptide (TPR) repeat protein
VSADPTPTQGDSGPPTVDATLLQGASPVVNGPAVLPAAGRYQLLRFHARGGLGEVFLAEDRELRREVALKFIRPGREQAARRRFVREAEITGRLEHPGIVPVYGLLDGPADRPCYAMRFIRGESLADAVERFHAGPRDTGSLRRLLTPFVTVCQVIAYAHSKGVIHRDIKPANVMLGPFGETYVVDWGLATNLSSGTPAAPVQSDTPDPSSPIDSDATQTGSLVGTPAYMSPEQAAGEWARVGPAADVFSLGATLYAILTGRPPYQGGVVLTVIEDAQVARYPKPRSIRPDVPPALEAVCVKAMAKEPAERYPSAAALAADIDRWLADEPVTARRELWSVRAWRWVRRHRTSVTGAAALLLTAVIALAIGLVVVGREQRRTEERRLDAEAARRLADDSARSAAEQRFLALETLKTVITDIQGQTRGRPEMQELQKKLLFTAQKGLERVARSADASTEADRAKADVYLQLGDVYAQYPSAGGVAAAVEQFDRALTVARRLVAADPGDQDSQFLLVKCLSRTGLGALDHGQLAAAEQAFVEEVATSRLLAAAKPNDPVRAGNMGNALGRLGEVYRNQGRHADAVKTVGEKMTIYQRLAREQPDELAWRDGLADSSNHLANLHIADGRPRDALVVLKDAIALYDRGSKTPRTPDAPLTRNMASALQTAASAFLDARMPEQALEYYPRAIRVFADLERADPAGTMARSDLAWARAGYGQACWLNGRIDDALTALRPARDAFVKLSSAEPGTLDHWNGLANARIILMDIAHQRGDAAAGVEEARLVADSGRNLAAVAPDSVPAHFLRAHGCIVLGIALEVAGDRAGAKAAYTEGADVLQRLRDGGKLIGRAQSDEDQALIEARLAGMGADAAAAAAAAEHLAESRKGGWPAAFNAACVYASASRMLRAGRALNQLDTSDQATDKQYTDKAMAQLREAVNRGMRNAEMIAWFPDLEPIRDRPEFTKLIADLGAAPPPK